jgi:hypothetical protein
MTSSADTMIEFGTVNPSALAVFTLTTDAMERINTHTRPAASASAPAIVPPTALITRPALPSSPACVVESANVHE